MRAMRLALVGLVVIAGADLSACGGGAPKPIATRSRTPGRIMAPRFEPREDAHVLPRDLLFAVAERGMVHMSPDGKRIGFAAAASFGNGTLWVGPADDISEAKPLAMTTRGHLGSWSFTQSDRIVYMQDAEGKEEWRVYSIELTTSKTIDLMPPGTVSAYVERQSSRRPHEIAIVARASGSASGDVWVVDVRTGQANRVLANTERFVDFDIDADFRPIAATRITAEGEKEVRLLPRNGGTSELLFRVPLEDQLTTFTRGADPDGKTLYVTDSRGRDTAALVGIDIATKRATVIAADDRADVVGVLRDIDGKPTAVYVDPGKREWRALDPGAARDFAVLADERHVLDIASRTLDDKRWLLVESAPDESSVWSIYDRPTGLKKVLFSERPKLAEHKLSPMRIVRVPTRDGLELVGYLSLPPNFRDAMAPSPLPTVLYVHGGPWDRDSWAPNVMHQLLANRGYAVLGVNFRGSIGFGKKLVNAGDREWGRKMQDDLLDAVSWAIARKIADPDRIAIVGGSYGGYAALMGMARDHGTFACGIDIEGPSNLVTFADSIPKEWSLWAGQLRARIGDFTTDAGRRDLLARSPLAHAAAIDRPLLIVQGKNDPRVNERESAQMAAAVEKNGAAVTYLLYSGEGHSFGDARNWRSFSAVMEVFLSQCLGGVHEPFGSALEGSTIDAIIGGQHIAGLAAAALR